RRFGLVVKTGAVEAKQFGLGANWQLPTLPVHHLQTLITAQSRGPFFKPVQLGAEPSDLGVKFVDPGVVTGLLSLPARLPCKHLRGLFQGRLAPTLQLRGVNPAYSAANSDTLRVSLVIAGTKMDKTAGNIFRKIAGMKNPHL